MQPPKAPSSPAAHFLGGMVPREEIPLCLAFLCMKVLVSFVYINLNRNLKDVLTGFGGVGSGMEISVGLKPMAFACSLLFVLGYMRLSKRASFLRNAYAINAGFLLFMLLYTLFLYPCAETLSFKEWAQRLQNEGRWIGYQHYIDMVAIWPHSLLYLVAELWSQVAIALLFWGAVNEVYSLSSAKRVYPLFIAGGCAGGALAAFLGMVLAYACRTYAFNYDYVIYPLLLCCIGGIGGVMGCLYWIARLLGNGGSLNQVVYRGKGKAPTFLESLRFVLANPYFAALTLAVVSCALGINLVELTWKASAKKIFGHDKAGYQAWYSGFTLVMLLFSMVLAALSSPAMRRNPRGRAWAFYAPWIITGSGVFFFGVKLQEHAAVMQHLLCATHLTYPRFFLLFGTLLAFLTRVAKYVFFDNWKEQVYIPLPIEEKREGKASVEILGSRLGKMGSSFIHGTLLAVAQTNSVLHVSGWILPFLLLVGGVWTASVLYLQAEMQKKIHPAS